jgi:hypothetical protein
MANASGAGSSRHSKLVCASSAALSPRKERVMNISLVGLTLHLSIPEFEALVETVNRIDVTTQKLLALEESEHQPVRINIKMKVSEQKGLPKP